MTLGLQDTIRQIQPLHQFSGVKKPGMADITIVESFPRRKGGDTHEVTEEELGMSFRSFLKIVALTGCMQKRTE